MMVWLIYNENDGCGLINNFINMNIREIICEYYKIYPERMELKESCMHYLDSLVKQWIITEFEALKQQYAVESDNLSIYQ